MVPLFELAYLSECSIKSENIFDLLFMLNILVSLALEADVELSALFKKLSSKLAMIKKFGVLYTISLKRYYVSVFGQESAHSIILPTVCFVK